MTPQQYDRLNELSTKALNGRLTVEERTELQILDTLYRYEQGYDFKRGFMKLSTDQKLWEIYRQIMRRRPDGTNIV
jgi:hypothetical protein